MTQARQDEIAEFGFRDITILVLSVYVIAALLIQTVFPIDPSLELLLERVDFFVCIIFLADFAIRFRQARSKLRFMRWGWIDLLSSIPLWEPLRWGRSVRVVRILRVLRAFRSMRHLFAFLYRDRTKGTLATAGLAVCLLIIGASIAILIVEKGENSTIKTPFDAIWWSVSTITTVGYGDAIRSTIEGKVVAMILMVAGIALFGVFTGLFARLFIDADAKDTSAELSDVMRELQVIREKLERMERTKSSDASEGRISSSVRS
jgi:voltage-gated potassium channel